MRTGMMMATGMSRQIRKRSARADGAGRLRLRSTRRSPPPPPHHSLRARGEGSRDASGEREKTLDASGLYRLMAWLSPAFPVGAFSYSSGIEWAVEAGDITNAVSLRDWLAAMLSEGSGFCDAVFLAQAHSAASSRDVGSLREIAELAAAFV